MDPRRQTENHINVHSGRTGGMQDGRLMRAARPGCKRTACGADCSACLLLVCSAGVCMVAFARFSCEVGEFLYCFWGVCGPC